MDGADYYRLSYSTYRQNAGPLIAPCDPFVPSKYHLSVDWYETPKPFGLSFMIRSCNASAATAANVASIVLAARRWFQSNFSEYLVREADGNDVQKYQQQLPQIEIVIIHNFVHDDTCDVVNTAFKQALCQNIDSLMVAADAGLSPVSSSGDDQEKWNSAPHAAQISQKIKLKYVFYPYRISKPGLELYVTPCDSVHSLVYMTNWAMQQCSCKYIVRWDADFIMTDVFFDALMRQITHASSRLGLDFDSCRFTTIDASSIRNSEPRLLNTDSMPVFVKHHLWEVSQFLATKHRQCEIPEQQCHATRSRDLKQSPREYYKWPAWWTCVLQDRDSEISGNIINDHSFAELFSYMNLVQKTRNTFNAIVRLLPPDCQLFTRANDPKCDILCRMVPFALERPTLHMVLATMYDMQYICCGDDECTMKHIFKSVDTDISAATTDKNNGDFNRRFASSAESGSPSQQRQRLLLDLYACNFTDEPLAVHHNNQDSERLNDLNRVYERCAWIFTQAEPLRGTIQHDVARAFDPIIVRRVEDQKQYHAAHELSANEQALYMARWGNSNRKEQKSVRIIATITTCKRFHLFKLTMRSFLRYCTDVMRLDEWICIDDGSSDQDREQMQLQFPWMRFIWKSPQQKGHRLSMNMLRDMILTEYPNCEYVVQLEDDWLFLHPVDLISQALRVLHIDDQFGQCLFVQNYQEESNQSAVFSGKEYYRTGTTPSFQVHQPLAGEELEKWNKQNAGRRNHAWWPGFSLRPGVTRTNVWKQLGSYSLTASNFEYEYATRYTALGYKTCMLFMLHAAHLGPPTYSARTSTNPNAYILNGMAN